MGGQRIAFFRQLCQFRYPVRILHLPEQGGDLLGTIFLRLADAQHRHLAEPLELLAAEFVDREPFKVIAEDTGDVGSEPIVRDDVNQKPAHHQVAQAVHQESLFIPVGAPVLPYHRKIRRIEEQGMKRLVADPGANTHFRFSIENTHTSRAGIALRCPVSSKIQSKF